MLALDGSVSPYLPTREILDAIQIEPVFAAADLGRMLRQRLALLHGVAVERIALFPNDSTRFERLISLCGGAPLAVYPPFEQDLGSVAQWIDVVEIERGKRFRLEPAQIEQTPRGAIALVMTPNDPTGNALSPTIAAHVARRAGLLLIDERSAEMRRRSMVPLVEEFDSIVLLRSFADWAGLGADAPGYAITTSQIAAEIDRSPELGALGLQGALAAVSNAATLDAIAQTVRLERKRLYRMLRKLNFLSPLPSEAGYVLAEVTRGHRDRIHQALLERDILSFAPTHPRLRNTLRFSALSPRATWQLQAELIEISRMELG